MSTNIYKFKSYIVHKTNYVYYDRDEQIWTDGHQFEDIKPDHFSENMINDKFNSWYEFYFWYYKGFREVLDVIKKSGFILNSPGTPEHIATQIELLYIYRKLVKLSTLENVKKFPMVDYLFTLTDDPFKLKVIDREKYSFISKGNLN